MSRVRGSWGACLAALVLAGAAQAQAPAKPAAAAKPAHAAPAYAPAAADGAQCRGAEGFAADFGGRRTFNWRPERLTAAKAALTSPQVAPAYAALLERADKALKGPTYTVVDKTKVPPSGDKHDYMSLAPYWWPDPDKKGGLPYVRRDGSTNPERNGPGYDVKDLDAMSGAVETLALAYYFSDDPRYAAKAAELLRVWFLDPATRMNPRLTYAQAVPGVSDGRGAGLIDGQRLVRVVDAIGLLGPSGAVKPAEVEGLQQWFTDYVQWMATSPTGREARAAKNNHGLWYDYQITIFALFAGMDDVARTVVSQTPRRLAAQIEPDGRLPLELERTRSLHYSAFALDAAARVAELGRCVGLDLWAFQTADGRGLRKAIDYVGPYAGREKAWPGKELDEEFSHHLYEVLTLASRRYPDGPYGRQAAAIADRYARTNLALTLQPPQ
jgi:hypothetical protein